MRFLPRVVRGTDLWAPWLRLIEDGENGERVLDRVTFADLDEGVVEEVPAVPTSDAEGNPVMLRRSVPHDAVLRLEWHPETPPAVLRACLLAHTENAL